MSSTTASKTLLSPLTLLLILALLLFDSNTIRLAPQVKAQGVTEADTLPAAENAAPTSAAQLALSQSQIAERYKRIEELILRMAEFEAANNPKRAALLRQAYKQSRDNLTATQLQTIVRLLNQEQLKRAVDTQAESQVALQKLLELLMTEDRSDRLQNEKNRIRAYIREVERLLREQRSIQGQNQGGADAERIAKQQGELAGKTGDLADKIRENEEGGKPGEGEGKPGEGEGKPGEGEGELGEGEPGEGEGKP
ncbi:MAG: hypothetical protein VB814_08155, partial [Pirellulaceae bacterium]